MPTTILTEEDLTFMFSQGGLEVEDVEFDEKKRRVVIRTKYVGTPPPIRFGL